MHIYRFKRSKAKKSKKEEKKATGMDNTAVCTDVIVLQVIIPDSSSYTEHIHSIKVCIHKSQWYKASTGSLLTRIMQTN